MLWVILITPTKGAKNVPRRGWAWREAETSLEVVALTIAESESPLLESNWADANPTIFTAFFTGLHG